MGSLISDRRFLHWLLWAAVSGFLQAAEPVLEIELPQGVLLKMQKIGPGEFTMGSLRKEVGRDGGEMPHKVKITNDFYLGIYEVTQEQFSAVMNSNPSKVKGKTLPVTGITRQEAMEFCRKLNQISGIQRPEGYRFSLPTEAQWEYACRAGTGTSLNNGKDLVHKHKPCDALDEVAWYKFNSSNAMPHPVGGKKPNAWGLFDMHGNVWEMCLDGRFQYRQLFQIDPVIHSDSDLFCLRGGSFLSLPWHCRSANRSQCHDDQREPDSGFRAALIKESFLRQVWKQEILPRAPVKVVQPSRKIAGIPLILLRPTRFWMGTPEREPGRKSDETLHEVNITHYFYIGKHEITVDEYQTVMSGNARALKQANRRGMITRKGKNNTGKRAVSRVSWLQAMDFCNRLNARTEKERPKGYIFSLPTEAEWEYACRAGSRTPLFGERQLSVSLLKRICNRSDPRLFVEMYRSNLWGLHDTIGNAAEWCLDSYAPYSTEILNDPLIQIPGAPKVYRGGWVGGSLNSFRCGARFCAPERQPPPHPIGFRVVLVPILSYINHGAFPLRMPKNSSIRKDLP